LIVSALLLLVVVPGSVAAEQQDGHAAIGAGDYLVLLNFTVDSVPAGNDVREAGSLCYIVFLEPGYATSTFDVMVLEWDEYVSYLKGDPFNTVEEASSMEVGPGPAFGYYLFLSEGDYVLLVDNTDAGSVPSSTVVLNIGYELTAENLEVHKESRWDLFIALMALVSLIGLAFLLLIRLYGKIRLAKVDDALKERCPGCGGTLPDYGSYCPHCGRKR